MPNLFKRRLIKSGNTSVVMVVPKSWIRYYGLRAGDKLEVIADGELIIRPEKEMLSSSRRRKPNCK